MATSADEQDKEMMVDLQKRNELLSKDVERVTNLLKQSERKRRKQKVVYEKNMENLSIRLADFESNLRREQKDIKELISKKDQQINVREELTKTLRSKLDQQHCTQCGYPMPMKPSVELDWQLEIDEEGSRESVIKQLPPLDLPPPEETTNIGFTNHRPFRPKSKLSPVAEESESTFASSLRNIHADLNPDRFHAALTASLCLLDESDGAETPTNSMADDASEVKSSNEVSPTGTPAGTSSEEISESPDDMEPTIGEETVPLDSRPEPENSKIVLAGLLSSYCDTLCSNTLKLVSSNLPLKQPATKIVCEKVGENSNTATRVNITSTIIQSFSLRLAQECLSTAHREMKEQRSIEEKKNNKKSVENCRTERLHSAAVKVADSFLSNGLTMKLLSQGIREKRDLQVTRDTPDIASKPDVASATIMNNDLPDLENGGIEECSALKTKFNEDDDTMNGEEISSSMVIKSSEFESKEESIDSDTVNDSSTLPPPQLHEEEATTQHHDGSQSHSSKKKKKKKKKKRKSVDVPHEEKPNIENVSNTSLEETGHSENVSNVSLEDDQHVENASNGVTTTSTMPSAFERIKSPLEDKYSLMLDEQLDVLDDVETTTCDNPSGVTSHLQNDMNGDDGCEGDGSSSEITQL